MISIGENGMFVRDGQPWLPVGFNYWPPESGVDCWTEKHWSLEPFRRDFRGMAKLGFNCARMFLRWPEFQPAEDQVSQVALGRLAEVGQVAHEAGIMLVPTLYVGFMSGGLYPPPWLQDRNLFTHPDCIQAAARLAREAARVLAPTHSVLAYDLSNEINVWCNHLPQITVEEAIAWQRAIRKAIHEGHPGAMVLNGVNHSAIIAEMPWNLRAQSQVPMEILSTHVYPVRIWNPLRFASLRNYEADILAPVHVAMGRAYGPVMLEEFGVAVPVNGPHARAYLFLSTIGAWLDGSNGFLMWGWKDFETRARPYRDNPFEKEICFLNRQGEVKESGQGFVDARDFLRKLEGFASRPPEIGIYLGDAYWEGCHATLGNSVRCFWLSAALRRAHFAHAFTDRIDPRFKAIIVPGPRLNLEEIAALRDYVSKGGCVLLGNIRFGYWCDDLKALADLDIVDMAMAPAGSRITRRGFSFATPGLDYFPLVQPRDAQVQATIGAQKHPALLVSEKGKGRVATLFAPYGEEVIEHPARLMLDRLLGPLLARWGLAPEATGLTPDVEARVVRDADHTTRLVLLNHGVKSFQGTVAWVGGRKRVKLAAKGATVLQP